MGCWMELSLCVSWKAYIFLNILISNTHFGKIWSYVFVSLNPSISSKKKYTPPPSLPIYSFLPLSSTPHLPSQPRFTTCPLTLPWRPKNIKHPILYQYTFNKRYYSAFANTTEAKPTGEFQRYSSSAVFRERMLSWPHMVVKNQQDGEDSGSRMRRLFFRSGYCPLCLKSYLRKMLY